MNSRQGRKESEGFMNFFITIGALILSYGLAFLIWLSHLFPLLDSSIVQWMQWNPRSTAEPGPLNTLANILFVVQLILYFIMRFRWWVKGKTMEK
jgi:hypothetical protein